MQGLQEERRIVPTGSPQFNVTVNGSSPNTGDFLNFALLAASGDAGKQKKLLFGPSDPSFNNGRSRLTVNSGSGFVLKGDTTTVNPSLMSMLSGNGTYYTFVDNGAFTVYYASVTNMDESGIQLSGSGSFSIDNSSFDDQGSGVVSTSTLFTLNNVTQSTITLTSIYYGDSTPNTTNFNYTIGGIFRRFAVDEPTIYRRADFGDANEQNDTGNHIIWQQTNTCQLVTSVETGTWSSSSTWDGGFIPTSCNPVFYRDDHARDPGLQRSGRRHQHLWDVKVQPSHLQHHDGGEGSSITVDAGGTLGYGDGDRQHPVHGAGESDPGLWEPWRTLWTDHSKRRELHHLRKRQSAVCAGDRRCSRR